jgi:hypothetical protein
MKPVPMSPIPSSRIAGVLLDFCFWEDYLWNKNSHNAIYGIKIPNSGSPPVGAAEGCDLLILIFAILKALESKDRSLRQLLHWDRVLAGNKKAALRLPFCVFAESNQDKNPPSTFNETPVV